MLKLDGKDLRRGLVVALWFMFLTFPLLAVKVNPTEHTIVWRWWNCLAVGGASLALSLISRLVQIWREPRRQLVQRCLTALNTAPVLQRVSFRAAKMPLLVASATLALCFPVLFSTYQVNILVTALMYIVLGLGLNIVVGVAGLLDLGYVAFYAVGAYSYSLLNLHYGIGFWTALPIGGVLGALFGILLGFPVLRLRGDYLAIVTLGFGEIIRLVLENWGDFSRGPSGIANIPRPGLFGIDLSLDQAICYLYYLMIALVLCTIFVVNRLQNSRIGRAWLALREDEIACQAMGIDKARIKLTAFSIGAAWAGMAGVIFAAKTTFVNPASFTFLESALILCIVVLGGMGSIVGVILAALILILLPEYLRVFADYRMLAFGCLLVLMMIIRPEGIMQSRRKTYARKR